jgi:hypothetical protein
MRTCTAVAEPPSDTDAESSAVHAWRVSQLSRPGLATLAADAGADAVDWHAVARWSSAVARRPSRSPSFSDRSRPDQRD